MYNTYNYSLTSDDYKYIPVSSLLALGHGSNSKM